MFEWVIGIMVVEVITISLLKKHMEKREWKGYSWGAQAAFYNNFCYGIFSLLFFFVYSGSILFSVWRQSREGSWQVDTVLDLGRDQRHSVALLQDIYLGSKVWEFQDLIWVYLGGMKPALTLQFHFHHLTTLPLTALSYSSGIFGEFWMVASNALAHIFVYFFFAGFRSGAMVRCMMLFGTLQLLIGISFSSAALFRRYLQESSGFLLQDQATAELITWLLYCSYALLWFHDILVSRTQRQQEAAKRLAQKKQ